MKPSIFALGGALFLAPLAAQAQNSAPFQPDSRPEVSPSPAAVSLTALLQMPTGQIERLNRLFDGYASQRAQQESRFFALQDQLRQAQSPTSLKEKKVASLLRQSSDLQQNAAAELLKTRVKALQILQPVQRAQLESVVHDPRFQLRRDAYYQLLLLPVEQSGFGQSGVQTGRAPMQNTYRPQQNRSYGSGNYGVYGGYGYGRPQVGVYGGYGVGGVGVYGGIGRGGPSIGIGIGGLFGGRRRGW